MFKVFLTLVTCILVLCPSVQAAKVDMYRDLLLSKKFTLKYDVQEIPIIQTSNDAVLTNRGLANKLATGFEGFPHSAVIVFNGDDRYNEIFHDETIVSYKVKTSKFDSSSKSHATTETDSLKLPEGGQCRLIKDGEVFEFFWDKKNDKKRYLGGWTQFGKSKSVKAGGSDLFNESQRFVQDYNFGTPEIARALLPLLPPEKIPATPQTLAYKFFGSGSLEGGVTYEDFISDNADVFSAIRYYFSGNDMTKIAQVNYVKENGKILGYDKSVIYITEFSSTPDQSYLSLPTELKDKTKRDKGDKK